MRVRITKNHVGMGRVLEAGEELDLSDTQAHDKIRNGKAVRVVPPAAAVESEPSSAPASDAAPAAPVELPPEAEGAAEAGAVRTTDGEPQTQDPPPPAEKPKGGGKKAK